MPGETSRTRKGFPLGEEIRTISQRLLGQSFLGGVLGQALQPSLHDKIKLTADPGIGGGVIDLGGSQGALLPVRQLGGFGKAVPEEDGGQVAKSSLFDFEGLG